MRGKIVAMVTMIAFLFTLTACGHAVKSDVPVNAETEQYKDMAAKFALYCEYIYLHYENRGTVTTGEITITEESDAKFRLFVYYNEPDVNLGTMIEEGGMGYMEFLIDRNSSQGEMVAWNYLVHSESPDYSLDSENPEVESRMDEAIYYYDYPQNAVFDFKNGVILSSGSVVADVNAYFAE